MIVGLTGGIGTGKSTVCGIFQHLGVPIIDADAIARHIVNNDKHILQTIIDKFGNDFLIDKDTLDRRKLRQHIFKHTEDRIWLERLLHPLIADEIKRQVATITYPYCIVAVPLLIEANMQDLVDRILTVDCSEQLQLERVMQRDKNLEDEARAIIASQLPRAKRLEHTNDLLENNTDTPSLVKRVEELHKLYLNLST